jgi:hypothetical protein
VHCFSHSTKIHPVAGELEELPQLRPRVLPVSRIELSTAAIGSPAVAAVRLISARAAAGIDGSISSPSMSRSSTPP